jgi:tetratricopeptide (TPR) repeat protein
MMLLRGLLLPLTALCIVTLSPIGRPLAAQTPYDHSSSSLQDPLQRLAPKTVRTSLQQDRLRAGALYATGRTLFQRGDVASALRHYQRAWRWDPAAVSLLAEIVPLAFSLERSSEAVRYALLSAQHGHSDSLLLRRLALYVTEQGDWPRAVRLYRKWLAHPDTQLGKDELDMLLVQLEIGRLEFMIGNSAKASQALGEFQQNLKQAGPAAVITQQLRQALGDDLTATWELCGIVHLEAKSYDLATEAYAEIDLPPSEKGRLGFHLAQVSLARNEPMAAWHHLCDYFKAASPTESREPYELLGEILARLNHDETLVLEFSRLYAANTNNPILGLALAHLREKQEHTDEAVALYQSIVNRQQETADKLTILALDKLIQIDSRRRKAENLFETLRRAAEYLPDLATLVEFVVTIPEHPDLVDRLVDLSSKTNDLTGEHQLAMACLLLADGRSDEATRFFRGAISRLDDGAQEMTLSWGLELLMRQQYVAAAEVFRNAIATGQLSDKNPTVYYYLSLADEMTGATDKALEVARKSLAMQPDSAEFSARIPWILYHAQRNDEAVVEYRNLIGQFNARRDVTTREQLRDARFVLSNLAVQQGQVAEGEEWLQQILDEFPEDAGAMNDLGYLWVDQKKHLRHARRLIELAVVAEPDNPAYRDSWGWALLRSGKVEMAVTQLRNAVKLSRETTRTEEEPGKVDGIILEHLGDALLKAKNVTEAIQAWTLALPQLEETEPDKAAAIRQKIERHSNRQKSP